MTRTQAAALTAAAVIGGAVAYTTTNNSTSHPQLPTIHGAVQHTYSQQYLCTHGTRFERPPTSYTNALKLQQMNTLHLKGTAHDYEEDHFISLSVGGDPRSHDNLWPEPWPQAHAADKIEYKAYRNACNGTMTQHQAQQLVIQWKEKHG